MTIIKTHCFIMSKMAKNRPRGIYIIKVFPMGKSSQYNDPHPS